MAVDISERKTVWADILNLAQPAFLINQGCKCTFCGFESFLLASFIWQLDI
jgi:hypothetical protein